MAVMSASVPPLKAILATASLPMPLYWQPIFLSIGSDSNTRLAPIEELCWAEYTARMRTNAAVFWWPMKCLRRGLCCWIYGTRNGARSLGLATGVIASGMFADFIAVDLHHPALAGWTAEDFLDVLFFGASSAVIAQTWVQGKKV